MRRRLGRPTEWTIAFACLLVASLLPQVCLAASWTGKDVQIIGKVLGFLDPPRLGSVVAVVYVAGNPDAEADAAAIVALFGAGTGGSPVVTAQAVPVSSLSRGKTFAAVIPVLGTPIAAIAAAIQAGRLLCVTNDIALVQAGSCTLAIRSEPRLEIIVNSKAAVSAGISFTTAFRMLIHEI